MRKFSPFKDALETGDASLHIRCPCRFNEMFQSLDEFTNAGGDITSETPLIVCCPRCQQVYVTDAVRESDDGSETVVFDLEVGSDRRELNAFRVGDCPECGATVQNTDYAEGPDHPDIGWKHYECPDCETGIRPERMGDAEGA